MTDSNNPNNPWAPQDQPLEGDAAAQQNPWSQASTPSADQPPANPWGTQPTAGESNWNTADANSAAQPVSADPYASSQPVADPFGQPAAPQGATAAPADPYGQPSASPAAPYGQASANPADPYGQPAANPYGTPAAPTDPWTQPAAGYQDPNAAYAQPGFGGYAPQGYYNNAPVLASWGKRAQGWLLDWFAPGLVLGLITNAIWKPEVTTTAADGTASINYSSNGPQILSFLVIAVALAFLNKNGQTPGRKWAGTQLVNEQGQPVQAGVPSLGRYLAHLLDEICFLGWLWPLWDKNRQTFADKVVKTRVIDLKASGIDPNAPRV